MNRIITRAALWLGVAATAACSRDAVGPGEPGAAATQRIAAGYRHVCTVVEGGEVFCWGNNFLGAVGNAQSVMEGCSSGPPAPNNSCSRVPRRVGGDTLRFRAITASNDVTCGITLDGRAACWGVDPYGLFGVAPSGTCGGLPSCHFAPVALPFPQRWKQLSIHDQYISQSMCGVSERGEGFCWGWSGGGVLGDGEPANDTGVFRPAPGPVAGGLRFREIAAGADHACGLTEGGAVLCWGSNAYGQLGASAAMESCAETGDDPRYTFPCTATPTPVRGGHRFVDIASSTFASCGVTTRGEVLCWGGVEILEGRREYRPVSETSRPRPVFPGTLARSVEMPPDIVASRFICAVRIDGAVSCRGRNDSGQLGNGTTVTDLTAAATRVADVAPYAGVALAAAGACGITPQGVNCWGNNFDHTLGRPAGSFDPNPAPVSPLLR